jgi:superfamily II DNA or RNA helicase/HKD family nuclease
LITTQLRQDIDGLDGLLAELAKVEEAETPDVLARFVAEAARRAISDTKHADRVPLVNRLLEVLRSEQSLPQEDPAQLLELRPNNGALPSMPRPSTPLSDSALLTNARDEPSLGAELRAELASADGVDLLCAFVQWRGIRVIEDALTELQDRGIPFRVITTTYVGATERVALDRLVAKFGAQVKVNYETQSTRLHAKAWLFRRNSGFNTAYVGSSNLSHSALVDGLEWNVRLSQVTTPSLIRKFEATFESYWSDPSFETYDPAVDAKRLDAALGRGANYGTAETLNLSGLEVRPYPFQQSILEALRAEREVHDRHRNLIIAATGTGKTVIAGLDYRNLVQVAGRELKLLFIAHRKEILQQARRVYREVMTDGTFGELFVDGEKPQRWKHVFASVQSLNAYGMERLDPAQFDVVVIDEFHHAEAQTYRRVLDRLKPMELLGLTATPERSDGVDVKQEFFSGRAAYELRLWDALEADLLVPFHYFGVSDDVDLSAIEWKRGRYDEVALDNLYTGNDARAAKVLRSLGDKLADVSEMRAIGFCVSVAHAEYMARVFNAAGVRSVHVSAATSAGERVDALNKLRTREINCIFAVDLFNEGLDIPQVDTVMLLRPTQSATVFLQQLGRGLRRAPGKAVLTVLDFIGQQRREFRFDVRYRALTGSGRAQLERQVKEGFPFLPSGSQMVLDRVVQEIVLGNIRSQLNLTSKQFVAELRSHASGRSAYEYSLAAYLEESGREIKEVYRRGNWTNLAREAGILPTSARPVRDADDEALILKRMSALVHVDDPERADVYSRLVSPAAPLYRDLSLRDQRYARMLVFTIWPSGNGFAKYDDALARLRDFPDVCSEIRQIVELGSDASRHVPLGLGIGLNDVPLFSHATYRREEILAGLGYADLEKGGRVDSHREGVAWCAETSTDALLVTLHKSERLFSPNTMYRDYALNSDLFHWESQNATSTSSPTGRRYLNHRSVGSHVVLFTRHANRDDGNFVGTYTCLGQADYVQHVGEKPIAITWHLRRQMPTNVLVSASAVAR